MRLKASSLALVLPIGSIDPSHADCLEDDNDYER